jgi:hypothetical protein
MEELEQRMQRLEGHQHRLQDAVADQLKRADAIIEDLVAAQENLRRRIETLERSGS